MNLDSLVQSIGELAKTSKALALQAAKEYAPIVDAIVRSRSKDTRHIEHTLDGLLDFCFDRRVLLLYKKLCRHYYALDPQATASYVYAYRDMWDFEEKAAV